MCSFDIVSEEFSQEMINIGATYGWLSVDNLFSYPTTISRNVIKEAELVKSKLAIKLKVVFKLVSSSFTTDMWTDNYRKISYISLIVHYINENWQIKEQVLAISKFLKIKHIAELIRKIVLDILKNYNLIPEITIKKFTFVTDSNANFILAFKNLNHIPYIAHR